MIISLIVAVAENGGIGVDGGLPWRQSADLRLFKALTMGHYLIVGRKTYESIGGPLPGRMMIVMTRNPEYQAPECMMASSPLEALEIAREGGETEVFVGGGTAIFEAFLPLAHRIFLTRVHAEVEADTFFPPFDQDGWIEVSRSFHPHDEDNQYPVTFYVLESVKVEDSCNEITGE
jgi:dihydrofolate reductase